MVSRVFLVLGVVALAAVGLGDPVLTYGPYLVTPCNGVGQPACNVPFTITPQPVPGLTNALFQSWFGSRGIQGGSTGTYTWFVTDVNDSGVAIGRVFDFNIQIVTGFVFDKGKLICCSFDRLNLIDINDNGFLVGFFNTGQPRFDAFVAYCCGGLNDGQNEIPLTFLPPIYNQTRFGFYFGIDDSNRILAQAVGGRQEYELDPTPEPTSIVLLATALGSTAFLIRRRMSRPRCS